MLILLVTLNLGWGSHAHWVDPRPKLFWLVNPTHEWVKPAKSRQNPWYGPSPYVSLTRGRSVKCNLRECYSTSTQKNLDVGIWQKQLSEMHMYHLNNSSKLYRDWNFEFLFNAIFYQSIEQKCQSSFGIFAIFHPPACYYFIFSAFFQWQAHKGGVTFAIFNFGNFG